MSIPGAYIRYSNEQAMLISGTLPISHGILPNSITLRYSPFPPPYPRQGDVVLTFGSQSLRLRSCRLISADFDTAQNGLQTMVFTVLDRRWKWKYGRIRGEYNIREGDGLVRFLHRKTPQELATLCLQAMGESGFSVSKIPNDTLPYVVWDGNPAQALQNLVGPLGCRVVWNPETDLVSIEKAGEGRDLPGGGWVVKDSLNVKDVEMPDKIIFKAGKDLYDVLVPLEAVGEDTNGDIVPIDQLSYTPLDNAGNRTWRNEAFPSFPKITDGTANKTVSKKWKKLAQRSIWRMYRVKTPCEIYGVPVYNIEQLLPLETSLGTTSKVDPVTHVNNKKSMKERQPAEVYGIYFSETFHGDDEDAEKEYQTEVYASKIKKTHRGFGIDAKRGIVNFSSPMYSYYDAHYNISLTQTDHTNKGPALLWLRTGWAYRDPVTNAWYCETVERVPPGQKLGVQPHYLERNDIQRTIRMKERDPGDTVITYEDNLPEVKIQANYYIDEYIKQVQLLTPGTRGYTGMQQILLDGAIQQVIYEIDGSGFLSTVISRNQEYLKSSISYEEKVRLKQIDSLIVQDYVESTVRVEVK